MIHKIFHNIQPFDMQSTEDLTTEHFKYSDHLPAIKTVIIDRSHLRIGSFNVLYETYMRKYAESLAKNQHCPHLLKLDQNTREEMLTNIIISLFQNHGLAILGLQEVSESLLAIVNQKALNQNLPISLILPWKYKEVTEPVESITRVERDEGYQVDNGGSAILYNSSKLRHLSEHDNIIPYSFEKLEHTKKKIMHCRFEVIGEMEQFEFINTHVDYTRDVCEKDDIDTLEKFLKASRGMIDLFRYLHNKSATSIRMFLVGDLNMNQNRLRLIAEKGKSLGLSFSVNSITDTSTILNSNDQLVEQSFTHSNGSGKLAIYDHIVEINYSHLSTL